MMIPAASRCRHNRCRALSSGKGATKPLTRTGMVSVIVINGAIAWVQ